MSSALKDTGCQPQSHGPSEPGGGPCRRCGRPRCSAAAKSRPGERCRKNPHPGATICTNHGLTAAGRAKAEEKQREAAAAEVVKAIWNTDSPPVTNPVIALQQLAGQVKSALDVLGNGLDFAGLESRPIQATAWLRLVRESRQLLADMERLGIAERGLQLEADRIRLMTFAVGRVFDALGLSDEQRVMGKRVLLEELRAAADEDVEYDVIPGQMAQ